MNKSCTIVLFIRVLLLNQSDGTSSTTMQKKKHILVTLVPLIQNEKKNTLENFCCHLLGQYHSRGIVASVKRKVKENMYVNEQLVNARLVYEVNPPVISHRRSLAIPTDHNSILLLNPTGARTEVVRRGKSSAAGGARKAESTRISTHEHANTLAHALPPSDRERESEREGERVQERSRSYMCVCV